MIVYFTNHSRHIVIVIVDDVESVYLQPNETKQIDRKDSNIIKVLVRRNCESYISKYKSKSTKYNLVIETVYLFSCVSDGENFNITREKIPFSLEASYDRLFLCATNANYLSETHKVLAEDKIKKTFNKSQLVEFVFDAVMASPVLIIILLLVGISLTFIWGWAIAVVYFPLAFLFVGALNWLTDKFWRVIGKKAFNMKDKKTEFYNYFENDFISRYENPSCSMFIKGTSEYYGDTD